MTSRRSQWQRNDGAAIGRVSFGANMGAHYRKNILLPFFEKLLKEKDKNAAKNDAKNDAKSETKLAAVYAFETATNVWREYPIWPPKTAKLTLIAAP